jgi:hypothetical protein
MYFQAANIEKLDMAARHRFHMPATDAVVMLKINNS